jgi:hypothetical protein
MIYFIVEGLALEDTIPYEDSTHGNLRLLRKKFYDMKEQSSSCVQAY